MRTIGCKDYSRIRVGMETAINPPFLKQIRFY